MIALPGLEEEGLMGFAFFFLQLPETGNKLSDGAKWHDFRVRGQREAVFSHNPSQFGVPSLFDKGD